MAREYVGSPWRSRFLRAPKVALSLAERSDFVFLDALAQVRLGLKTGADKFFFLKRVAVSPTELGTAPVAGTARLHLTGFNGWTGSLSVRDVRPTALNPHELYDDDQRLLVIPRLTPAMYLDPRDGVADAELAAHVRAGEREGINRRPLVQQNASPARWYKQVRGTISPPLALPYNSGYDYGVFFNPHNAILNGRFVGVDPHADVDPVLLGAALNSTFVILTRLLVGVATGTESAYDVGPPAARRLLVPDVRRLSPSASAELRDLIGRLQKRNRMPGAPDENSHVDPMRHSLDLVLLEGLGLQRAEAQILVGEVYQNYARWREAVRSVEMRMRQYRKDMKRGGRSRRTSPIDQVAQRVWDELMVTVRRFPVDLLRPVDAVDFVDLPRRLRFRTLQIGLQPGLLILPDGKEVNLGDHARVRYVEMLQRIGFEPPYLVPTDPATAEDIVQAFQADLARVEARAKERIAGYASNENSATTALRGVERRFLQYCRSDGMAPRQVVPAEG